MERKNLVNNVKKLDEAMLALRAVAGTSPAVAQTFPGVLQSLAGVRKSVGVDGPQQLLDFTAPPAELKNAAAGIPAAPTATVAVAGRRFRPRFPPRPFPRPELVMACFQTKAGDIALTDWHSCRGQLDLLRTNALAHPSFNRMLPRKGVFVITGRLLGGAPLAAQDYAEHLRASRKSRYTFGTGSHSSEESPQN